MEKNAKETKPSCNTCEVYALNELVRIPKEERTLEQNSQLEFEGLEDCGSYHGSFPKNCIDYVPHESTVENKPTQVSSQPIQAKSEPSRPSGHGMVEISKIKVGNRMRILNQDEVARLAESIKQIDLLNPIVVDADMNLIAGYHRLEACKLLGMEKIKATISNLGSLEKELAEIDENLIRNELSALERSEHLGKRKEIYEKLHPETKQASGKDLVEKRWNTSGIIPLVSKPSFVEDTAKKLNVSESTVEKEIKIAKSITPEVKSFVQQTPALADKKTALLEIAKTAPEKQMEIAKRLAIAKSVKSAKSVKAQSKPSSPSTQATLFDDVPGTSESKPGNPEEGDTRIVANNKKLHEKNVALVARVRELENRNVELVARVRELESEIAQLSQVKAEQDQDKEKLDKALSLLRQANAENVRMREELANSKAVQPTMFEPQPATDV